MRPDRLILSLVLLVAIASCSRPAGTTGTDREAELLMRQLSSPRQPSAKALARAAVFKMRNDNGSAVLEAEQIPAKKIDDPLARLVFQFYDPGSRGGFSAHDPVTACYEARFNYYGVMGSAHRVSCPKDARPLNP